jgi:PhoPQ-activated pathogenicity-related protein
MNGKRGARIVQVGAAVWASIGAATAQPPPANDTAPGFAWEIVEKRSAEGVESVDIDLTSQLWRGEPWRHAIRMVKPPDLIHGETALLAITGGSNGRDGAPRRRVEIDALFAAQIARNARSIAVILGQVPNQPLFGRQYEDDAIAYTFDRYLDTGDPTWPLLGPMTQSAVSAMDAATAAARELWGIELKQFFVSGASKRGWTAWLTAAADPRVIGIAPAVIDNLNLPAQMKHQIATWGAYSPEIEAYTRLDLPQRIGEPRTGELIRLIDPYSRRERLTMPKLILVGTNDPYWVVDAARFYFSDLSGPKHLYYIPNGGHGPGPGAAEAIAAYYSILREGGELPKIEWTFEESTGATAVAIRAEPRPLEARLWSAESLDADLHDAAWSAAPIALDGGGPIEARVEAPEFGRRAFYVELRYAAPREGTFGLCTEVRVVAR